MTRKIETRLVFLAMAAAVVLAFIGAGKPPSAEDCNTRHHLWPYCAAR